MSITPDQAGRLKRDATDGPWEAYDPGDGTARLYGPDNARLIRHVSGGTAAAGSFMSRPDGKLAAAAPDLAQTIAGMRWEYAVEHEHSPGNWHQVTQWGPEENPYQPGYGPGDDERIVRRLVGPVEVAE